MTQADPNPISSSGAAARHPMEPCRLREKCWRFLWTIYQRSARGVVISTPVLKANFFLYWILALLRVHREILTPGNSHTCRVVLCLWHFIPNNKNAPSLFMFFSLLVASSSCIMRIIRSNWIKHATRTSCDEGSGALAYKNNSYCKSPKKIEKMCDEKWMKMTFGTYSSLFYYPLDPLVI